MILGPLLDQTQNILFSIFSHALLRLFELYKRIFPTPMGITVTKSVHNLWFLRGRIIFEPL
jgi:hypothetical protein